MTEIYDGDLYVNGELSEIPVTCSHCLEDFGKEETLQAGHERYCFDCAPIYGLEECPDCFEGKQIGKPCTECRRIEANRFSQNLKAFAIHSTRSQAREFLRSA